jgi:hypothetical protein
MIVFNTIKKAEHYVKWYSKHNDFHRGGYDWESHTTYIFENLIVTRTQGDGCGCGCGDHLYDRTMVIGRIKKWDTKSIRAEKIQDLIQKNTKIR